MSELADLQQMVNELKNTSSSNEKKEIVARYPSVKKLLNYTFNTFKQYYVSWDNVLKNWKTAVAAKGPNLLAASARFNSQTPNAANTPKNYYADLYQLLDALDDRKITGQKAISEIVSFISRKDNIAYKDIILDILDRDLKCRISSSIVNKVWPKLIPEFNTALANSYWDNEDKVDFTKDVWFASRKLDGVRLLTIIDEDGDIKCMSRNGKEFTTLTRLKEEIKEVWPQLRSIVFDGEICIVDEDGDEHFDQIIRLVNKKDFTIPFPKYRVFDILGFNEFAEGTSNSKLSTRQARWDVINRDYGQRKTEMIVPLVQTKVETRGQLDALFAEANDKNWEGLIIRKDAPYQGKRSNDMLKVKAFHDAEYTVTRLGTGPFRYVKDGKETEEQMLTQVYFMHGTTEVGCGSGFTIEQRQDFYQHPEKILGKTIKVKYFEETTDQNGNHSLRFPVIKQIYEDGRFD